MIVQVRRRSVQNVLRMERIDTINPERVRWCCADRGITVDELPDLIGINSDTFQRMMQGASGLTYRQLQSLAAYFDRGVLFFLERDPVNEIQVHSAHFRTLANQKPMLDVQIKRLIERAVRQRELYLSLLEDLGETAPPVVFPTTNNNPVAAASAARIWLNLSINVPQAEPLSFNNYRAAIEAKGILVIRSNGYAGPWQIDKQSPICGFSIFEDVCPVIVVKKQPSERRQTFTLMHELGHLMIHRQSNIDTDDDLYARDGVEREANSFAGHLLVPDEFLEAVQIPNQIVNASDYEQWLAQYGRRWGVSIEVILRRLLDRGRLAQAQYQAYRTWRSQTPYPETDSGSRQWRHREPKAVFGEPFVRTVFEALHARKITLNKASTYLDNIKIVDVHKLEGHLAST